MTRMRSVGRGLVVLGVCAFTAVGIRPVGAQQAKQQSEVELSVKTIASQLGVKVQPRESDDLTLGSSFTGTLETPEKLADFGIKGMHAGARVTVFRSAPEKVRVEVDEVDPAPARGSATLKPDGKGGVKTSE